MTYTEVKNVNGKRYFYRIKSVRKGKKVERKSVYLGANLDRIKLLDAEKKADKELMLLSSLLSEKEINELNKIKKQYTSQPKEVEENMYESFISLFTYDSTAIEGNTLTLQETSQLLFEGITPRKSLREINEVINHKNAFDFILKIKEDICKKIILKLHELVIINTLKPELNNQIGKYRTLQVYIRGTKWLPPKPKEVPKEMAYLLSWYSKNKGKLHPIIFSAYFHSAFETIHPFVDGNGRVGRLLMNFILHKNGYPMINIPNKKRYIYYGALESAQLNGNLRPLVEFLLNILKEQKIKF